MPASPTRQRKLHIGHFAFLRAVVQGRVVDEVGHTGG